MKLYDLGITFIVTLLFAGSVMSMAFEAGQKNPEANNILETTAKPNPHTEVFGVDEVNE